MRVPDGASLWLSTFEALLVVVPISQRSKADGAPDAGQGLLSGAPLHLELSSSLGPSASLLRLVFWQGFNKGWYMVMLLSGIVFF